MSESVHAPPPVRQPNQTLKSPLTDMPTGLMATLVMQLADHLPIRRSFDEFAVIELRAGAAPGDQVGCVDRAPVGLCGFDEFDGHRHAGRARAGSFGDPGAEPIGVGKSAPVAQGMSRSRSSKDSYGWL